MTKWGIVCLSAALTACASSESAAPAPIGMPNPASAYCLEQGGSLEIVTRSQGQVGICTLPDDTMIEEWELMRRDHPAQHG